MIHSIKDFSDDQIEELRQCPGVSIDTDNLVAEVPFIAEGLFFAIAKNKEIARGLQHNKLEPISGETLIDLYLESMNKINAPYIEGVSEFIEKQYPELDTQINMADNRINRIWHECNIGKSSIEDFENVLKLFEDLYFKGFELYENECLKLDIN